MEDFRSRSASGSKKILESESKLNDALKEHDDKRKQGKSMTFRRKTKDNVMKNELKRE